MLGLLLLDPTPNTVGYLVAGYIFLVGVPILYVISWFVRQRSLERDIDMMESLAADEQKRAAGAKPGATVGPRGPSERKPDMTPTAGGPGQR
jgi:hypothetical protein